jgi:hypothetical protein
LSFADCELLLTYRFDCGKTFRGLSLGSLELSGDTGLPALSPPLDCFLGLYALRLDVVLFDRIRFAGFCLDVFLNLVSRLELALSPFVF